MLCNNLRRRAFRSSSSIPLPWRIPREVVVPRYAMLKSVSSKSWSNSNDLPIDITKLMLPRSLLQCDSDVECSTSRDCPADSRHDNDRDVVKRNVLCRFRYKHKTLVQAEEMTFHGFDAAFNSWLLVMAVPISRWLERGAKRRQSHVKDAQSIPDKFLRRRNYFLSC